MINKYKELINYLIFGILTTVISLLTYYILVFTFLNPNSQIELQIANIISWITSVTFAYITNKKYVFKPTNKKKNKELLEFYSSRLFSLFLDMLLMYILVSKLKFNNTIIKLLVGIIVIITNYLLSKLLIFKE